MALDDMAHLYIVPQWFFGIDISMEILFGIITFLVAFSAYKIYKISKEKPLQFFGMGFLLISISYFAWALMNIFALSTIRDGLRDISFDKMVSLAAIGMFSHMFLLTIGLVTLVYATLSIKNPRIYYLLLGLGLLVLAASYDRLVTFRILSVFLLSYLTYHYFVAWRERKGKNLLCSFIAFALLLFSNLDFAFSASYYQTYVVGHILQFGAYMLILKNLIKVNLTKKPS